jgi:ADP-L-glycero-D-manno-heptose 6-epimerase
MKTYLVTGNRGFIGRNLCDHLMMTHDDIRIVGIDLLNTSDVFDTIESIDWNEIDMIYHQGAISDTTEQDIGKLFDYNIAFSIRLFELALHYDIPVHYASSASIYGNSRDYSNNPLNYYAMSKLTVDMWVQNNIHRFDKQKLVGFRYYNVYGIDEDKLPHTCSPVFNFSKQAQETGVIKVFEDSDKSVRDFVSVVDVVSVITNRYENGIYDLGTSEPVSFQNVAEIIAKKYSAKIETIPMPNTLKDKYQYYSKARKHFPDHKFMTVQEYVDLT